MVLVELGEAEARLGDSLSKSRWISSIDENLAVGLPLRLLPGVVPE